LTATRVLAGELVPPYPYPHEPPAPNRRLDPDAR
jgi:hypothetical protein